jgi:hypothetical protein
MKLVTKAVVPLLGLISVLHFGCRTLSTSRNESRSGSEINGMLYYLPVGKITIKGEFKTEDAATRMRITGSKSSSAKAPHGGGDEGSSNGATEITAGALTITLISEVESDERAGEYYVVPHANYLYDDETQVIVNAKHLLSTGNVTSEDKTVQIVGELAAMAGDVIKGAPGDLISRSTPTATPTPPFYFSFHPSSPIEVSRVRDALRTRAIYFDVRYPGQHAVSGSKEISISSSEAQQLGQEGLIFRPGIPYKVVLRYPKGDFDESNTLINTTQQFILPDTQRLYEMKYKRMPFVKKVKNIGFTDGMLSDYHQTVPSPLFGFLGIPKAILQAIVPIPGAGSTGSASSSGTSTAH